MAEQRPLQTQHVPAQDLITATHGSQPLTMLDAVPGGYNSTRLHRDCALSWHKQQQTKCHKVWNHLFPCPAPIYICGVRCSVCASDSPFSTLVRSLPCLAFSNRGWWPWPSSPASLHDLSNRAPSPQGAVLWTRAKEETRGIDMTPTSLITETLMFLGDRDERGEHVWRWMRWKKTSDTPTWCRGERWCQVWFAVCFSLLAQIYCRLCHHST